MTQARILWMAVWRVILKPASYSDLHIAHILSRNLNGSNPDFAARYNTDPQYREEQLARFREAADRDCESLRRRLGISLVIALSVGALALGAGWARGAIAPGLPLELVKLCNFLGTVLAAWATLFGLGTSRPVWGGDAFPDLVAPMIFRATFVPGAVLLATGAIL